MTEKEVVINARYLSAAESKLLRTKLADYQVMHMPELFIVKFLEQEHLVVVSAEQVLADSVIFQSIVTLLEGEASYDEFMFRPIEELNLNVRIYNALKRKRIETFGPLVEPFMYGRPEVLLALRNFGPSSLDILIVALVEKGLAPERFHPVFNQALLELIGEEALLAKGFPQQRIDEAKKAKENS